MVTDSAGAPVATWTWGAYGKLKARTGTLEQPLGFAGEYADAETGFVYLRARYYDPATGQFLSRDPIEALTRQPYAYAFNNPTNYVDPRGLVGFQIGPVKVGDGCALGRNPNGSCRGSGAADDAWDATGGKAVSYVNDHKVGIMQGGSIALGVGAIFVSGGTAPLLLAAGSALLAVGSEAADSKPCRGRRIAQTAALAGVGLVGGVLWQGASHAARMAPHAQGVGAGTAENIGRVFGAGDIATNLLPDPCSC